MPEKFKTQYTDGVKIRWIDPDLEDVPENEIIAYLYFAEGSRSIQVRLTIRATGFLEKGRPTWYPKLEPTLVDGKAEVGDIGLPKLEVPSGPLSDVVHLAMMESVSSIQKAVRELNKADNVADSIQVERTLFYNRIQSEE